MKQQNGLLGNPLGVLGPALFRTSKRGQSICVPRARFDRRSLSQEAQRAGFRWYMPRLSKIYQFAIREFSVGAPYGFSPWEWACWSCLQTFDPRNKEPFLVLWDQPGNDMYFTVSYQWIVDGIRVRWKYDWAFVPWKDEGLVFCVGYDPIGGGVQYCPVGAWYTELELFMGPTPANFWRWCYMPILFRFDAEYRVIDVSPAAGRCMLWH